MDLQKHIDINTYNGVMSVSDVHANIVKLLAVVNYARANKLFIVFLGDVVDGFTHPTESLEVIKEVLDRKQGVFTIGNHDDKLYRWSIGNNVMMNADQLDTLDHCGDMPKFRSLLQAVVKHPMTDRYHHYGKTLFVHAAPHQKLWTKPTEFTPGMKSMSLYGEVNGERDDKGFPVRLYNWIETVPKDCLAVVGHDRTALGKNRTEIGEFTNTQGGSVYFTDTSCGKQDDGPLSSVIFYADEDELKFVQFKGF